jgi:hypothetical protein
MGKPIKVVEVLLTPAEDKAHQGVETTGTLGFSYFSTSSQAYAKIGNDSATVYLLPFRRGKNGMFGDGSAMQAKTFYPTK